MENINGKTILAIGAHVGDMELTAGALLASCAVSGGRAVTLALTAGEKGAPAGADVLEYRKNKVAEAERFAAMLGGEAIVLDHPDGLLPDNDDVRFEVCDVIRRVKPDIIVTHHEKSMHKDHAACHRIVVDAWFYAAIEGFRREMPKHFARSLYFAENWEDAIDFKPTSISTSARAMSCGKRPSTATGLPCTARASHTRNTTRTSNACAASRGADNTANAS